LKDLKAVSVEKKLPATTQPPLRPSSSQSTQKTFVLVRDLLQIPTFQEKDFALLVSRFAHDLSWGNPGRDGYMGLNTFSTRYAKQESRPYIRRLLLGRHFFLFFHLNQTLVLVAEPNQLYDLQMKEEEAGRALFKPQIHKPNGLCILQLKYVLQMKKEEAGRVLFKPQIHKPNQLYILQLEHVLQMQKKEAGRVLFKPQIHKPNQLKYSSTQRKRSEQPLGCN
jgi:hypothetical protein